MGSEYTLHEIGPKLVCAMYGKRKIGVAFAGGGAFLFISPLPGEPFDPDDFNIVRGMVAGYNAGLVTEVPE